MSAESKPTCDLYGSTKRVYDGEMLVDGEWIRVCHPCLVEPRPVPIDPGQGSLL